MVLLAMVTLLDERYILQWINEMYQREADSSLNLKVNCDLTWIVADQDPGTKVEFDGWKDLTAANSQRIVFKGTQTTRIACLLITIDFQYHR